MAHLRLIGDVHGHYEDYIPLLQNVKSSLQIGDFGFDYTILKSVDARQHRIIGGNHDNYDEIDNWPHYLGNYGVHIVEGFGDIFFIRGGLSIDRHLRTEGVSWWQNEELTMQQCYDALELYEIIKPNFVVSHECPASIVPYVTQSSLLIKSRTNQLLEQMFAFHKPDQWVFGHYHRSWDQVIEGTRFVCLDELECLDFDKGI